MIFVLTLYLFRVPLNGLLEYSGFYIKTGSFLVVLLVTVSATRIKLITLKYWQLVMLFLSIVYALIFLFKGGQAQIIFFPALMLVGFVSTARYSANNHMFLIVFGFHFFQTNDYLIPVATGVVLVANAAIIRISAKIQNQKLYDAFNR